MVGKHCDGALTFVHAIAGDGAWVDDALWAAFWLATALVVRHPLASIGVLGATMVGTLVAPTTPTMAFTSALGFGLAGLVAWRRPRWTPAPLLLWSAYLAAAWNGELDVDRWAAGCVTVLLGALFGLTAHHFLAQRQAQRSELARLRAERREARLQERRQLAGELHDIVAHQLSLISMQIRGHHREDPADGFRAARDVARINASARADLATLVHVMRQEQDESTGRRSPEQSMLTPSLAADGVAATLRTAGHTVSLSVDPQADDSDPTTQRTVSRVLREATTNVLRYAPEASCCTIDVTADADVVSVRVTNPLNRTPQRHAHSTGYGLLGLRERAALTGGRFSAGAVGDVWVVQAHLRRWVPEPARRPSRPDAAAPSARDRRQRAGIDDPQLNRAHEHLGARRDAELAQDT